MPPLANLLVHDCNVPLPHFALLELYFLPYITGGPISKPSGLG